MLVHTSAWKPLLLSYSSRCSRMAAFFLPFLSSNIYGVIKKSKGLCGGRKLNFASFSFACSQVKVSDISRRLPKIHLSLRHPWNTFIFLKDKESFNVEYTVWRFLNVQLTYFAHYKDDAGCLKT